MTSQAVTRFDFKDWNDTLYDSLGDSVFGQLSMDVITHIASYLPPRDMACMDRVCRAFYVANTLVVPRNLEMVREAWARLISLHHFPPMSLPEIMTRKDAAAVRTNLRGAVQRICSTEDFQPALANQRGDLFSTARKIEDEDFICFVSKVDPNWGYQIPQECASEQVLAARKLLSKGRVSEKAQAARELLSIHVAFLKMSRELIQLRGLGDQEFFKVCIKLLEESSRMYSEKIKARLRLLVEKDEAGDPEVKREDLREYFEALLIGNTQIEKSPISIFSGGLGDSSMRSIPKEIALLQEVFKPRVRFWGQRIRVIPPELLREIPNLKELFLVGNQVKTVVPPVVEEFFQQSNRSLDTVETARRIRMPAECKRVAAVLGRLAIGAVVSAVVSAVLYRKMF
jgi:hypothetical protein